MKKGTILILVLFMISPLIWWSAYHLLYPLAVQSSSVAGLMMGCCLSAITSMGILFYLMLDYEHS